MQEMFLPVKTGDRKIEAMSGPSHIFICAKPEIFNIKITEKRL